MKRLYIVLTVVLSSFLLLTGREVKADTYSQEIDLSLINEDFLSFKEFVESSINSLDNSSSYFFIVYTDNDYVAYVVKNSSSTISPHRLSLNSNSTYIYNNPTFSFYRCKYSSKSCSYVGSPTFNLSDSSTFLLYTNVELTLYKSNSIIYTSVDKSWVTSSDSEKKYFSVYDVYQEVSSQPEESEPVDNTPILTDFYSIVIEKFGYLCGVIVSNYIYLSIFVIILIIILFELIFRRRL